jgi:hypothetical protein
VAGRHCGQAGGRVILVFGEAFSYEGLHPIADKFGTQCGWSAGLLGACVKSPKSAPLSSKGAQVARPKTEQVKC